MMNNVDPLKKFIADYSAFYIIGHEEPDGDCICSQIGLAMLLQQLDKKTQLVSPGPFVRPEVAHFESQFSDELRPFPSEESAAVFIVDCSTPERIGRFKESIGQYAIGVIDHHAAGTVFGDVRVVVPNAPSVTYLILELIESYGFTPSTKQAELLMFGLATDTGFFRHLELGSERIFEALGRLVAAGASPKLIHFWMYGNRPLDSRTHLAALIARAREEFSGKLLVTHETIKDRQNLSPGARDSDTLYLLLTTVTNVEAVAFIREETDGHCSVSLRSNFDLDVGAIARSFGGGGHKKAAGYEWEGSIAEAESAALEALKPYLH